MQAVVDEQGGARIKGRVRFAVVAIRRGAAFVGVPGLCIGRYEPVPDGDDDGCYVSETGRGMRSLRTALSEAASADPARGWYYVVSVYDSGPHGHVWWPVRLAE